MMVSGSGILESPSGFLAFSLLQFDGLRTIPDRGCRRRGRSPGVAEASGRETITRRDGGHSLFLAEVESVSTSRSERTTFLDPASMDVVTFSNPVTNSRTDGRAEL